MDYYVIVLRIIHILGGVFWAGGAFALIGFVSPAAAQAGPAGGKFMQRLTLGTRWIMAVSAAGGLAVLSGLLLYWRASGGLRPEWLTTGSGITFTIGGLAAGIALTVGIQVGGVSRRMAELGQKIEAAGGPPSPENAAQLAAFQARLQSLGSLTVVLLVITLLAMASARYISI
ncbi:MAG: hypothetical protein ACRDHG_07125 [Anaerolineales bacterium]